MSSLITEKEKRYVGVRETALYGVANGGQVIGYNLIRMQLTFFYVTVFGIPAKAVTAMIFFMGIWDALNDPLMGSIVDRTRTRFGKLRPYLIFVPIPLGIATVAVFGGAEFMQDAGNTAKIVYMCVTYFIWEFFYTIGDIPFWGLSSAISPNPNDRSRAITSARFISNIIGGIVGVLIPVFIDLSTNDVISWTLPQVFLFMGVFAGTVGMALFSLSGICTRERVVQSTKEPSIFDSFRVLFNNKPLLLLVLSNVLGMVEGLTDVFSQYYYKLSLGFASLSILAGIPGTVMGFFSYLLIPWLEKRYTSKQIVIRVTVLKAVVTSVIFLCGCKFYRNPSVIVPLLSIQGFFTSAVSSIKMVIPTKMVGDTVDYMEWKTHKRNEGMTFSLLTFMSKLTGSLSTALATAIIPIIGLQQVGSDMVLQENGPINTRFWLWGLVTAIPAVLNLLSLIPYIFYDLEGKKLETIHADIKAHRESRSKEVSQENLEENCNG